VASLNNEWDGFSPADDGNVGYEWMTYPERLQAVGVSWIVYENMPDNFGDNALVGFKQYRRANQASGKPVGTDGGPYPAYDPASDDAHNPLYKGVANTMPGTPGDADSYFRQFREDCRNGKLPQVSWVVAPATYSEHPGPSSPVQGAWYIQQVLDALTANPEVWSKTVLFINFDENDGYFDHFPSPAAPSRNPDGTLAGKTTLSAADIAPEYNNYPSPPGTTGQPQQGGGNLDYGAKDGRVFGPGVRVPMYVVSPWSRGGWVNSQATDHTSVIRFLEARFGVKEPNISGFRRAALGDLTSAFNFAHPNNEPLPTLAGRRTREEADAMRAAQQALPQITPAAGRAAPVQAAGYRPSRALPYELNVLAQADVRRGHLRLVFRNTGRAGAVFHVYDKLKLDAMPGRQPVPADPQALIAFRDQQYPRPRRYLVQPDKQLDDVWTVQTDNAGRYDLWVLGPNGFHRRFKGDMTALRGQQAPAPEARVSYDARDGNLRLEARNEAEAPVLLQVRSNRVYGPLSAHGSGKKSGAATAWDIQLAGRDEQSLRWNLDATGWWYDLVVTSASDPSFLRRFAGRMETGRHSVSDPAMGLADSF
jgi:phospholipase C